MFAAPEGRVHALGRPGGTDMKAIRDRLAAQGVHSLLVQFTDIHGTARGKLVPLADRKSVV